MRRTGGRLAVGLVLIAVACTENAAPGNDREAGLEPPASPAAMASAGEALQGVAVGLVMPQIMTEADRSTLPGTGLDCRFRMTRVGMPVLLYGSRAVLKVNGKLVPLLAAGDGRYAADGISVTVGPLSRDPGEGVFEAEMVLRLPDTPNELGFHGFAECPGAAESGGGEG